WEAFPALAVALLLQAIFFGFGGITSLGANVLDMALPAVVCWYVFAPAIRRAGGEGKAFILSFAAGATGVALGCVLVTVVLVLSGGEFVAAAAVLFAAHIPVMAAEGFITAAAVTFLLKVRPDLVGPQRPVPLSPGVEVL
ncbi:MAG: energy-coupling factor ABC transporter permease, partial [Planctomycetes bacterium]|nr:energy-coupling factor ABC transporter permease [Planctomycetota bacterium]